MRLYQFSWRMIIALEILWVPSFSAQSGVPQSELKNPKRVNERQLLKYVFSELRTSSKAARINYVPTSCGKLAAKFGEFPSVEMRLPPENQDGISAIREMFRGNMYVQSYEDKDGVLVISIGDVPGEILQTKIHYVRFPLLDRYNPALAISDIENNKAVRANDFQPFPRPFSYVITSPSPRLPHLPESLSHITMNEALNRIATTFEGVVLYGACPESRSYIIDFVGRSSNQ